MRYTSIQNILVSWMGKPFPTVPAFPPSLLLLVLFSYSISFVRLQQSSSSSWIKWVVFDVFQSSSSSMLDFVVRLRIRRLRMIRFEYRSHHLSMSDFPSVLLISNRLPVPSLPLVSMTIHVHLVVVIIERLTCVVLIRPVVPVFFGY